jgi:uncharacterized protein (TIGR02444 family)
MALPAAPGAQAVADDRSFWSASVDLYGRPGVADACLRLQDDAGFDADLLLLALHAGRHGRRIDADGWRRLDAVVAALRSQVIVPLRAARRWLKRQPALPVEAGADAPPPLGPALLALELQAERHAHALLEAELAVLPLAAQHAGPTDTAAGQASACNLRQLAQTARPTPGANAQADLAALLRAAHPTAGPGLISWFVAGLRADAQR